MPAEVKKLDFNPHHVTTYDGYHTEDRFKDSSGERMGPVYMVWDEDSSTGRMRMSFEEVVFVVDGELTLTFFRERGESEVIHCLPGDLVTITQGAELIYAGSKGTRILAVVSPLS